MPNAIVTTDGSNKPITLSIAEQRGHHIQTIIRINNQPFAEKEGDVTDLPVGTNAIQSGTTIAITTTAVKISPAQDSVVVFTLDGANEPHEDISTRQFNGDTVVTHHMTYDFL